MKLPDLNRENRLSRFCCALALGLTGLMSALLSVYSILLTCRIDEADLYAELVNYDFDSIPLNLLLIAVSAIVCILLLRSRIRLNLMFERVAVAVMLAVTATVALSWVLMVRNIPGADAGIILKTARDAASGNYTDFHSSYDYYGNHSYYLFYPFQLGYVFFAEVVYRIFGTGSFLPLQIANVIALELLYLGLVKITRRLFERRALTVMTALALTVCFQPMFMTTFAYGLIIGVTFAVWGVYFIIRYMKEDRLLFAGIAAVLMALAVLIKYNNMILLAAVCIALILHTVDKKRLISLVVAAVMILCSVGLQKLVIFSYAQKADVTLNTQVSQTLYAYMGMSDSRMAPGWYNGLAMETLRDADMDIDKANETAKAAIKERLSYLKENNLLHEFYQKKLMSFTIEPSFESIWISNVCSHDLKEGEQLPAVVTSIYAGGLADFFDFYFNWYVMIAYLGFAAGMAWMIIRKKANPCTMILPVAVLGGVLYHILFEAKSQYFLPYFVLLIPFAMYGILTTAQKLNEKLPSKQKK